MNSNNSNNSNNNSYSSNNINKSKLRTKRPFGALQNQYPEFYTASSKKFKYSNDSNMNIIAFNSENNNKKNAVVFSSFSNDVDMNSQSHLHNPSKYLDSCNPDIKRQYYEKIKQEMSNYKSQTNKSSSIMRVNYDCCNN